MLYITTRDNRDANTAYKTLHTNTGVDGGAYLPFRMPAVDNEELESMVKAGVSETIAAMLNRFFSCGITHWDVDFCIGRNSVKVVQKSLRLTVAELWHNPKGTYSSVVAELYKKIAGKDQGSITEWFCVAARIAILFGVYVQMRNSGIVAVGETFNVSLPSDDFDIPMAAFYARQIGLPIDVIICTAEESSGVWDFVHLGELNTALTGENFVGFERYIYAKLGEESVNQLIEAYNKKRTFRVPEENLSDFHQGLFCATAGKSRGAQTINSMFRSNNYILDPQAALCVGGLQDYRAKVGESKHTLVLSEISPLLRSKEIAEATGISQNKLTDYVK